MFASILSWIAGLIIFIAGAFVSIAVSPFDRWYHRKGDFIHIVSRYFGRSLLWTGGINVQVLGLENLPRDRAVLICANHQSLFDIALLDGFLPLQFRFVVKKELFSLPILGLCLILEHQVKLDRKNRRKGIESIRKASELIKTGRSVAVFPEGTRSPDGTVKPFRKGSLLIATDSRIPVLPVTISGSYGIMSKGSFRLHSGTVKVIVHPPIETEGLSREEHKTLSEKVRQVIIQGMDQ